MKSFPAAAILTNHRLLLYFLMLSLVTLAAYANAWSDALVFDDKFFVGSYRFSGLEELPFFFTEDLWAANGTRSGLYRPMLLISLFMDASLYGDWVPGYHLNNIALHVLVTLLVFGLVRQLLRMTIAQDSSSDLFAFLGALIFAVHPVHTEAVNSIFNRSEMLAAIGMLAGLWWFLNHLERRPARAWAGLGVAYLFALLAKESAVALPVLAVALVLVLTPGRVLLRLRKCLPALWLLIPLSGYLMLRAEALAPPEPAGIVETTITSERSGPTDSRQVEIQDGGSFRNFSAQFTGSRLPDEDRLLGAAELISQGLGALAWPYPQKVYYEPLTRNLIWIAILLQLLLVGTALYQCQRGCCALVTGLAFFYLAFLPVTRFLGFLGPVPPIAERYLYFPSVSLSILLAFGLRFVAQRNGIKAAVAPVLAACLVLTPLCWARNAEWVDEVVLFEADYRRGVRGPLLFEGLTASLNSQGKFDRTREICELHLEQFGERAGKFALSCAETLARYRRFEEAERAFVMALQDDKIRPQVHNNLGIFYLRLGRRDEAIDQLELAIEAESGPAFKAFRAGKMIMAVYGNDPQQLLEARKKFEEALRLQPRMAPARQWLERLNRKLQQL